MNNQALFEPTGDTYFLSQDGVRRINEELDRLITVRRSEVAEDIRLSREYGDISESTEYAAAKATQAQVELRKSELNGVLARARVLDANEIPYDRAGIGAEVQVRDLETDEDWAITLVNSIEADPERDLISVQCPLGEALIGKRVGEVVVAATPIGEQQYEISKIRPARGIF